MSTEQYSVYVAQDRVNAIFTDAMARMYGLVALGIVTTGATIWVGDMLGVGDVISSFGWIGLLIMFGIMFGVLMGANAVVSRGNTGLGTVLYLGFTAIAGLFLSPILTRFTTGTIGVAFVLTAGMFIAMSVVGMTTKKDLSKLGPMLIFGLIGVVIVSLINMILLGSGILFLLINIVLLPIFLGLTVWETKQMKELAQDAAMRGDTQVANQVAVIGSIGLYLNALNIFIILLNLLGFMSDD